MSQVVDSLSADRVLEYQQQGYLDFPRFFSAGELAELRRRTEEIAAGRGNAYPDEKIELEPGAVIRGLLTVRKINDCAAHDDLFMRYAVCDRILDVVQALLGADLKLFGSQIFMKPPGGVEKPYHQDSAYFAIEPYSLVTCWIALDDVTVENGCLWAIPGSHRRGLLPHSETWYVGDREDKRVPETEFDRREEVPLTLPAGGCSFHHSLLLHYSRPNQTSDSRRGLAFHYMTAHSRWTDPRRPQPRYLRLRGREYPGCV